MKKQLALTGLVASLAILGGGSVAQAVFQSQQTAQVTAQATTGGVEAASFVLSLHPNTSTATTATNINWTGALPGSGWKVADQLAKLVWNVTDAQGGIQIYSDNKAATATPQFVDPTPAEPINSDSNPAGLLMVPATGNTSGTTLPVAWSIKASTVIVGTELLAADPNTGPATGNGNRFQWLYLLDKGTPAIDRNGDGDTTDTGVDTAAFVNADPFVMAIGVGGTHGTQAPGGFFPDADKASYLYLQADFTTAAAQTTYRTSRLTFEAFLL